MKAIQEITDIMISFPVQVLSFSCSFLLSLLQKESKIFSHDTSHKKYSALLFLNYLLTFLHFYYIILCYEIKFFVLFNVFFYILPRAISKTNYQKLDEQLFQSQEWINSIFLQCCSAEHLHLRFSLRYH